ncbi:hypothetical protein RB195_024905 [Necator americanus]|uniref:Uncharacterized protein n=1 Tax=Necator americanus TaxID=51031 RepID=A0ABR1EQ20_NECAM
MSLEEKKACGRPSEVDDHLLKATTEDDPLKITREIAQELGLDHSKVVRHLEKIGKVKKSKKKKSIVTTVRKLHPSMAFAPAVQWTTSSSITELGPTFVSAANEVTTKFSITKKSVRRSRPAAVFATAVGALIVENSAKPTAVIPPSQLFSKQEKRIMTKQFLTHQIHNGWPYDDRFYRPDVDTFSLQQRQRMAQIYFADN